MSARVAGKIAVVTGGAAGIGRATVEVLAGEGAVVVIVDVDEANGKAAAGAIWAAGGHASFVAADVTNAADWERVASEVKRAHRRLDVLVNNAGGGEPRDLESDTPEGFRRSIGLNLEAAFLGTRACLPLLRESAYAASVVNVSSGAGLVGTTMFVSYSCAKAGLLMLTRLTAVHAIERGDRIRCNAVCPGITATPAVLAGIAVFDPSVQKTASASRAGLLGARALGQCADVASAILYLASEESKQVNGATITVDGGFTAL